MKKRLTTVLLLFALALSLTACSQPTGDSTADAGSGGETYEIIFGHPFNPGTPQADIAEQFKTRIEEVTDGQITVTIFPAGQLGSHTDMFEAMQMGTQHMSILPSARISGFAPEMQVFDLPFLFPDRETAYKIFDGEIGREIMDTLDDSGVKGLTICEDGFKHFTANEKIETLDDFKGLKMRTMESPIIMEQFNAMGSNPVPIDYSELYNSLQNHTVDGQENPLATISTLKLYEVQDYMLYSEHAYLAQILLVSKSWYESLPTDLQDDILTVAKEVTEWERQEIQNLEAGYLQEVKDSGTTVYELSDAERERFRTAMASVYEVGEELIGKDLLDKVVAACESAG